MYKPHGAGIYGMPAVLRNDEDFQKTLQDVGNRKLFYSESSQGSKDCRHITLETLAGGRKHDQCETKELPSKE
jgi:hypothetical protein